MLILLFKLLVLLKNLNFIEIFRRKFMKKSILFIFMASFILTSCASTSYLVSKDTNIDDYDFVVFDLNSSETKMEPALCGFEVKIFDTLNSEGLKSLGAKEILNFSEDELKKTLFVNTNFSQIGNEVILSLNFVDAFTGRPVANCYSTGDIGLGYSKGINKATEKIQSQIKLLFSNNPEQKIETNAEEQNLIELESENSQSATETENAENTEVNSSAIKK